MNLIDRDALVKALGIEEDCEDCKYSYGPFCKKGGEFVVACECITDAPTIDAVEVVRCGECKHMMPNGRCREFADERIRPSSADFCSCGERREA